MRPVGTMAIVASALALGTSVARADEQVIGPAPGASGISAYGGWVVWSERDTVTSMWRLMRWHAGQIARLPVPPRSVPFDADAGPDAAGRPVVVYSRCSHDPRDTYYAAADWSEASGCDIYELRLGTQPPRRLNAVSTRSASETTPSIWGNTVVFARLRPSEQTARLLLYRFTNRNTRRLRGGTTPTHSAFRGRRAASINQIDLGPRAAAFVWLLDDPAVAGNDGREWQLWLDATASRSAVRLSSGEAGECALKEPLSPNAVGLGAEWVESTSNCGDPPDATTIRTFDWSTNGTREASPAGFVLGLARDGATQWQLRSPGFVVTCLTVRADCELVRADP
jgi:hypothetical protein